MVDNRFHWLTGDVNYREYGGTWYRRDDETTFTIIEMVNMENACGDISNGKYLAIVSEVDTSDPEKNESALQSCGWTMDDVKDNPLFLVEAYVGYGTTQFWHNYSNNFYKLLREAKFNS